MPNNDKLIDPIDATFDDLVGAVLEADAPIPEQPEMPNHADLIRQLTTPSGWGVSMNDIAGQSGKRMDAEHYDPAVMENNAQLSSLGVTLSPLSDFADVHLPSMFTRIWAQDSQYGLPYLNATDLMSYFALGVPAQERYLSRASNVKMDQLIVKKEMILMTCSGTLGRVFDVPPDLDGWAGTHDIVRITPHDPELKGFLRAYLASSFAQVQILSHTHGGQIDHITGDQIASCLVPSLDTETISRISKLAVKADKMRSNGVKQMNDVLSDLAEVFGRG
jgi:type I restriction enzyme S subunit